MVNQLVSRKILKFHSPLYTQIVKGLCACMHSSVHANSPMLCSFRVSFIGECSENDFKDISNYVPPVVHSYISTTTGKSLCDGIFTSDFKLISECDKFQNVVIKGPSGCGKTYALASLFALCVIRKIPCVLFSSNSFEINNAGIHSYCTYHMDQISGESSTNQHFSIEKDVLTSLHDPSKQFMVFVDFSKFHSDDSVGAKRLMHAVSSLVGFDHKFVVSISSSVEISSNTSNDFNLMDFLSNNHFFIVEVKGFTFTEALRFVKAKNCKNITLNSIQYFCGTNPLLLSLIKNCSTQSVAGFKDTIKQRVKSYFVKGLRRIGDTIESYFMRDEMLRCSEFVNDASMEVTLTGDRITQFEQTFLCRHQLAILDYRETRSKVQEDQHFAASTPQLAAASEPRKIVNPVFKWIFPIVTDIYKDMIKNYIRKNTDQRLKDMCARVATGTNVYFFEKSRNQVH